MEAIGQDDRFAPEELLGFAGGELADGSEDVGLVRGELLYLVLGSTPSSRAIWSPS